MNTLTYQDICDHLPVKILTNTPKSPFWWVKPARGKKPFQKRYAHENAKRGDRFMDGNNGDTWLVLAACPDRKRIVIENKTQGGVALVIWDVL
jgi:hypothetical protein